MKNLNFENLNVLPILDIEKNVDPEKLIDALKQIQGAYSLVILTNKNFKSTEFKIYWKGFPKSWGTKTIWSFILQIQYIKCFYIKFGTFRRPNSMI